MTRPDAAAGGGGCASSPWHRWIPIVAAIAVYGQACGFAWVSWDDPIHVTAHPGIEPPTWEGVAHVWQEPYRQLYIPVSYTLFAAEAAACRLLGFEAADPRLFHAVGVVLQALAAGLVHRLLARLVGSGWPAVAGAVLFAVHPLQAESVCWISEQRGLLATVGALVCMNLFVAACQDAPLRPWHDRRAWGAAVALCIALLAKPSAVAAPVVLACLLRWPVGWSWRDVARAVWPLAVPAAVIAAATRGLQSAANVFAPLWSRPIVAGDALAFYAAKLVAPAGLCMEYGRTPAVVVADPAAVALAVATLLVVLAIFIVPRLAACRGPLALALAGLAPVLGLVPFTFQEYSTVADRYAALPLLAPAVAVAFLCRGAGPFRAAVVAAGLVLLAAVSAMQVATWRDSETLYRHAMRVNPRAIHARMNLGLVLLDKGKLAVAAPLLAEAVSLAPTYAKARYNLGLAHHDAGRPAEAEASYRRAIDLDPGYAEAHNNLGILLCEQGRVAEGRDHFLAALRLQPGFTAARRNLARAENAGP